MEYKLKEFDIYSKDIRDEAKEKLEYEFNTGIDKNLKQYEDCKNTDRRKYNRMVLFSTSMKICRRKVLETPVMLEVYLDDVVRGQIIKILNLISRCPEGEIVCNDEVLNALNYVGFSDALEYLEEFDKVEDVRNDLFRQAGIEFISIHELQENMLEAETSQDKEKLKINELLCIKSGIDRNSWSYTDGQFILSTLVNLPNEYLEVLTCKNNNFTK